MNESLFGNTTYTIKDGKLIARESKSQSIGSRPGGLQIETGPGFYRETQSFTCQHCNRIVEVKPFCSPSDVEFGGQCKGCMGLICLPCYDKAECKPIEKWCEEQERKGRFRRELGG